MTAYAENSVDSTKNLLELISEFGKIARYKIKTQKNQFYFCACNEQEEIKNLKAVSFTVASNYKVLRDKSDRRGLKPTH